jgi:hypothetical protein
MKFTAALFLLLAVAPLSAGSRDDFAFRALRLEGVQSSMEMRFTTSLASHFEFAGFSQSAWETTTSSELASFSVTHVVILPEADRPAPVHRTGTAHDVEITLKDATESSPTDFRK